MWSLQLLRFGRCRVGTENEKEVGTEMRTFMGPHEAQGLGGEAAESVPELEAGKGKSAGTMVGAWKE